MLREVIILVDGTHFYYSKNPANITNSLGAVVAVLQEYLVINNSEKNATVICKLYKTKEGNWYDKTDEKITIDKQLLRQLKSAIDDKENALKK